MHKGCHVDMKHQMCSAFFETKVPCCQGHRHLGFSVSADMNPISHPSWFIGATDTWGQMDIMLLITVRMDTWTQISILNLVILLFY